ncbi:MAG: hypothetical protein HY653_01680, partial [Acidobacteria bacterium]|nr:hypothetical protein [Acidobacteriota bacterium]
MARAFLLLFFAATFPGALRAQSTPSLTIPQEARAGLELLYQGDFPRGTALFRTLQAEQPDHPLGYL